MTKAIKEKPIIMQAESVRPILNTKPDIWPAEPIDPSLPFKFNTRRVVKPQPAYVCGHDNEEVWHPNEKDLIKCPYPVGTRLWVREAWRTIKIFDDLKPSQIAHETIIFYESDNLKHNTTEVGRYRHAWFMPRWASRITLEVTGVRVERVQDITYGDCMAEGLEMSDVEYKPGWDISKFRTHGYSWESNPWVWIYEFKRFNN